ncbi:outer membrane protein assembly factor BamA [Curvibacter sp. HBC28]|uniref:Outer membrane protein assembly factor BamA n=1 Tax=Curvibacter microcysteis TaxID=3026419 RepID=A0ABT5MDR7_9BURK|nr:outer membrane protein assembly factor BamA [Curvibacter sp. HBC28]MDD0814129.1 outer membrane protein assembly factor BamA [Curvibacter sp. HBC28]
MNIQLTRFRLRSVAAVAALIVASHAAWALDPFTVGDIRVEGLQRVEPGTIFASLPFRVGETYNDDKGSAAIRALFALGLFKDVRLEANGNVLVVVVEERPTVADLDFVGIKEFDKDTMKKAMRDVGLADGRPFDKALADRAEQELKRQYISRSLYGAEVVTTVTPIERNRVNITFSVVEGEPAKIKDIRVVGNQAFSESTLRGLFDLDTGGWLSWYTKSDRYARAKLNADLETLRSYYLSRGYLEFRIDSTQVAISPDKKDISITINVTEGERFVVSSVKLEGDYLGKEEEFKSLVSIRAGEPYNADAVAQTTKAFSDYFGNFGFAFARVEARPEIDRSTNRVSFVLAAEPLRRAYVRRIQVTGNSRTRDEVVRREFRQFEASWYDADRIRLSRDRVDRLGFFKDVNIETQEVPGSPDQIDLSINVTEKPAGSIQLGAGFSSAERVSLSFSIRNENIFGSGNYLGFEINTSKYNRVVSVSATDPYFTVDGISRTVDVYHRALRPYADQGGNYRLVTTGAGLRFGVPFSEVDRVFVGLNLEQTTIQPGTNIPAAYLTYAETYGYTSSAIPLTLGWSRDDRDSALAPNSGRYQRFNSELGLMGDARYTRNNYQYQQYVPLNKKFTLAFNGEIGLGKGLGGRPFPVFKNFYGGGLGSVRGFDQGTLGPHDVTGAIVGGAKKVVLNAELTAPFPGAGNDRTLRVFGFTDLGNIYGENEKISTSQMRGSVGVGLSWVSPMGPLRFAIANPVRKFAGDRIQKLQFQIGTSF